MSRDGHPTRPAAPGGPGTRLCLLLLVLGLLATGCTGEPTGSAARVLLAHDAEVATGQGWAAAGPGEHLADGAELRTGEAEARLQFRHGQVWLGPATRVALRPGGVTLLAGDLMMASGGSLTARWDGTEVAGDAVFRLTSGVAPRLAVYAGEVTLVRPGEREQYPQLREVGLAAARLDGAGSPLRYHASDLWDRRLLPEAVAFDAEVDRLASDLDRRFGTAPQSGDFYRRLPGVADAVVPTLRAHARRTQGDAAFGPASDALVTLFVAEAVAARHDLPVEQAVREVAALRALGAPWGIVAREHDLSTRDLAAVLRARGGEPVAARGGG